MASSLVDTAKPQELHIQIGNKPAVAQFAVESGFTVLHINERRVKNTKLSTDLRNVLYAEMLPDNTVKIATLARRKKSLALVFVTGTLRDPDTPQTAQEWISNLMTTAYNGAPLHRRLKVLVNPAGGKGRGIHLFEKKVRPILVAAHCEVDAITTERPGHATDLAQSFPLDYDALLTVSGDGLIFEVMNGFRRRPDSAKAFALPICPIPAGSGNALSINLFGVKEGFDIALASLNAIKGKRMSYDLCSFTQNGETSVSFLSQAIGLMADIDLGTENLRWMGDTRFIAGYLRSVGQNRPCAMTLSMRVVHSDKTEMAKALHTLKASAEVDLAPRFANEDVGGPEWLTFEKPILYLYAGTMPYVGRDLMAFPVSLPSDGLVDVSVQELVSRPLMLKMISGAEKGDQFWLPSHHYYKVEAYRLRPHESHGNLSIDGERFPYKEFHVEVLKGLGTTLSLTGTWAGDFGKENAAVKGKTTS
ncbi:diacylglycerol kinase catalytic domain-containing protein [Ceratobasidium sp. AG-Ba]|nr:diacylglycerol kinase catalytic domain-containing protein [Ceratobasidium sp. AG-Ba]QRW14661.1 diacylglycerol kinase catalytic domain-containing protein [Ceratobasidium sp. AG-Ba]